MPKEIQIENIKRLITDYASLSREAQEESDKNLLKHLPKLIEGYSKVERKYREENVMLAQGFNIFEILRIKKLETITHSPFIAHLLDPNEEHAQGNLFYKLFLETVVMDETRRKTFLNINPQKYWVKPNDPADGGEGEQGFIDITIQSADPQNRFTIIIENKIGSSLRKGQLQKYYEAKKNQNYTDNMLLILFLTLQEEDANEGFNDVKLMNRLKKENILVPIRYKVHIAEWLEKSLQGSLPNNVRYAIEQYLTTIKSL